MQSNFMFGCAIRATANELKVGFDDFEIRHALKANEAIRQVPAKLGIENVHNKSAILTDCMGVRFRVCIKVEGFSADVDAPQLTYVRELIQIAIDRCQTELGVVQFQFFIHDIRGRVLAVSAHRL